MKKIIIFEKYGFVVTMNELQWYGYNNYYQN